MSRLQKLSLVPPLVPRIRRDNTIRAALYQFRETRLCDLRRKKLQYLEALFFQSPDQSSSTGLRLNHNSRVFECRQGKIFHWYCADKDCHILLKFELFDESSLDNLNSIETTGNSPSSSDLGIACAATLEALRASIYCSNIGWMSRYRVIFEIYLRRILRYPFIDLFKVTESNKHAFLNRLLGLGWKEEPTGSFFHIKPENRMILDAEDIRQFIITFPLVEMTDTNERYHVWTREHTRCSSRIFDNYRKRIARGRKLVDLAVSFREHLEEVRPHRFDAFSLQWGSKDVNIGQTIYKDCLWTHSLVFKAPGETRKVIVPKTLSTAPAFLADNALDEWTLFVIGSELKLRIAEVLAAQLADVVDADDVLMAERLVHRCARFDRFSDILDQFFGLDGLTDDDSKTHQAIAEIISRQTDTNVELRESILLASTFGSWIARLRQTGQNTAIYLDETELGFRERGGKMLQLAADILNVDPKDVDYEINGCELD